MEDFQHRLSYIKSSLQSLTSYKDSLQERTKTKQTTILSKKEESHLNNEIKAIEQIFKKTTLEIKEDLSHLKSDSDDSFLNETKKSHFKALTKQLTDIVNDFRNLQVESQEKEEKKAVSQFLIENPECTAEQAKEKIFTTEKEKNLRVNQIVESINELCDMINELHEMVQSQGKMVDKIDENIGRSKSLTEKGKKSLESALNYQRQATRFKRILLVIGLVIVLLILGYFGFKGWSSNRNNNQKNQ